MSLILLPVYMIIVVMAGFYFKRESELSVDHYFRGNGEALWWVVGSTAFIGQFSALSFTVIAAKAYYNGVMPLVVYYGSGLAFIVAFAYFAPRYRRLNVTTPWDIIRWRFGRTGELLSTVISLPGNIIFPAFWLNATVIILQPLTGLSSHVLIIAIGAAIVTASLLGGSWAVLMSDSIQTLLVLFFVIVAGIAAFLQIGQNPTQFTTAYPRFFSGGSTPLPLFLFWSAAMLINKFFTQNQMTSSFRFLAARSEKDAGKGALLASVIYLALTPLLLAPVWAARSLLPDIEQLYPQLNDRAASASYLAFVENFMPPAAVAVFALMVTAATMSSIDTSLNLAASAMSKNIIVPLVKNKNSQISLFIARITTLLFGLAIISTALYYNSIWNSDIFSTLYQIIVFLGAPVFIPATLGLFIKRGGDWVFTVTIAAGALLSFFLSRGWLIDWFPLHWQLNYSGDLKTTVALFAHLSITAFVFILLSLWAPEKMTTARSSEKEAFFACWQQKKAVKTTSVSLHSADMQRRYLQLSALALAICLCLLALLTLSAFFLLPAAPFFLTALLFRKKKIVN